MFANTKQSRYIFDNVANALITHDSRSIVRKRSCRANVGLHRWKLRAFECYMYKLTRVTRAKQTLAIRLSF